jgi:hypothetical protein
MSDLVKVQYGQADLVKGGIGLSSKYMQVRPDRIALVQPTSQQGTVGKLRIASTGEEFSEMQLVLLFEPVERRSFFEGEGFSADNLSCYSLDMNEPDPRAKYPQAEYCKLCPKADWTEYRKSGKREDLPPCKTYLHNLVLERATKLPYYLDVRSTSIKPFSAGLQQIARQFALLKSKGVTPNIFDFSFVLTSEKVPGAAYYTMKVKDVAPIAESDRAAFGDLFLQFINRGVAEDTEVEEVKQDTKVTSAIVDDNQEYVI